MLETNLSQEKMYYINVIFILWKDSKFNSKLLKPHVAAQGSFLAGPEERVSWHQRIQEVRYPWALASRCPCRWANACWHAPNPSEADAT